jgi:hypothetical protein
MRTPLPALARARLARLCAIGAVAALAATAAGSAAPPKAQAQQADCGVRLLCLYSGVDYSGRVIKISERDIRKLDVVEVDPFVRGRVSSWINTTTLQLCGYEKGFDTFLWRGSRFTRDPYVGDRANNRTRRVLDCG